MKKFLIVILWFALSTSLSAADYALQFDGVNDHVTVPQSSAAAFEAVTIEMWFYWNNTSSTSDVEFLIGKNEEELEIHTGGGAGALGLRFLPTTGVYFDVYSAVTVQTWHHIAFTYDPRGTGSYGCWIDGSSVSVNLTHGSATTPFQNSSHAYELGERGNASTYYLNGRLDEVRIWDDVRTELEIRDHMYRQLTGTEENLVLYYSMSNGSGTTLSDDAGSNDGTIYGPGWVDGVSATIPYDLDGDSKIEIGTAADLVYLSKHRLLHGKNFEQTADISFSSDPASVDWDGDGTASWDAEDRAGLSPIGSSSTAFSGHYDGQGYSVSNLFINRLSDDAALFGAASSGASISNVNLINTDISGQTRTAALCANAEASIEACSASGSVRGTAATGGLIGYSNGAAVQRSSSNCEVTGNGDYTGGFIGSLAAGSIENCYSTGDVIRNGENTDIGGFAGRSAAAIRYCYSTGTVYEEAGLIWDSDDGDAATGRDRGFVGTNAAGSYSGNFFNTTTSEQSSGTGATAVSSAEMQDYHTFTDAGWDFITETANGTEEIWDADQNGTENSGFPLLSWQDGADYTLSFYSGGEGSLSSPYYLSTPEDLIYLSRHRSDWMKYFIQTSDISFDPTESNVDWDGDGTASWDAEDQAGFMPIGDNKLAFEGSYDGNGHVIDNLYISRSSTDTVGFFGHTASSTVRKLGLNDVSVHGKNYTGALIGFSNNESVVSECYSSGSVVGYQFSTGGLVAYSNNSASISNSYSRCSVSGYYFVGGLVGHNVYSTISRCYSTGTVYGPGTAGGLVGTNLGTVTDSFWDVTVSGQTGSSGGTGLTTSEMKVQVTYTDAGWDFISETANGTDDLWSIDENVNDGYPCLLWPPEADRSLPVTLSTFTGKATEDGVVLEWETSAEIENAGFIIRRQEAGVRSQVEIPATYLTDDALRGQGTTTEAHAYSYTDHAVEPGVTYIYTLSDVDFSGKETRHPEIVITVESINMITLKNYVLLGAYPNPFNPATHIKYSLPVQSDVMVIIFDISGRQIKNWSMQEQKAGWHEIVWDGTNNQQQKVSTGIYIYQMQADDFVETKKMTFMK